MTINFVICNASLELYHGNKKYRQTKLTLLQEHIHNTRSFSDEDLLNGDNNQESHLKSSKRSHSNKRDWSEVRPDIVHFCLLSLHDSILNKEAKIQVYIHTLDNKLYKISKDFRIPRTFKVFNKVFANFLYSNSKTLKTETGEILVELLDVSLDTLVPNNSIKIAIDNKCKYFNLKLLLTNLSNDLDNCWFYFSVSPTRSLDSINHSDVVDVSKLHKQLLSREFKPSNTSNDTNHLETLESFYSNYSHSNKPNSKYDYCISLRHYNLSSLANCYTLVCTLESILNY